MKTALDEKDKHIESLAHIKEDLEMKKKFLEKKVIEVSTITLQIDYIILNMSLLLWVGLSSYNNK